MNVIKEILESTGKILKVHVEPFNHDEPFIDFAARFSHLPGTVVLLSGGELDCARYHILAAAPFLTCSGRGRSTTITTSEKSIPWDGNPFEVLKILIHAYAIPDPLGDLPVMAGLFGYLSYDLKDVIEALPRTSIDDLMLPHLYFIAPAIIFVHDKKTGQTTLCIPERTTSTVFDVKETLDAILQKSPETHSYSGTGKGFDSNFTKETYMDAIQTIREYIASGEVYQVNMSQRFHIGFKGNPFSLFSDLFDKNPAPFFAFINAKDHAIVSTSPERFLCQKGRYVESRPIKGTRPRGKTDAEDQALKKELAESRKDDAELSMIVDLIRNDMGKVCDTGTVKVSAHKRLETYQNVHHLVSVVEGALEAPYDAIDLIQAAFPGGSITGCPKIRSMEIIDELETVRRHIYTGSIGYISFHETLDLSIAIRTATIYKDALYFSVGGGVVYDSDPLSEFNETLHKGQTLTETIMGQEKKSLKKQSFIWQNGAMLPAEEAAVPVSDLGFQYGFGFFETIRVVKGQIRFLNDHMNRFNQTWKRFYKSDPPDLSWDSIIQRVIEKNGLMNQVGAIKILSSFGSREAPPFNGQLIVSSRPYHHRLDETGRNGVRLVIAPFPRETWLSDHKSMNYLYYYLAGQYARETNGDEALILNPDQSVSETNTANILLISGKTLIVPKSRHVLPGVMEKNIIDLLSHWGYSISKMTLFPEDLFKADQVIVSNSLMGAVPALSLDQKPLPRPGGITDEINRFLL